MSHFETSCFAVIGTCRERVHVMVIILLRITLLEYCVLLEVCSTLDEPILFLVFIFSPAYILLSL